jgi:hypothetical protein
VNRMILVGLAIGAAMMTHAHAGSSIPTPPVDRPPVISPDPRYDGRIIDRSTAIQVCIEDVQDMQQTGEVPETLARYRRYLRGLKIQLQKEGFKNWRDLMWGAAIKVCMQDEGYVNTCVSKREREGDLQMIETAKVPSCWDLAKHAEEQERIERERQAELARAAERERTAELERQRAAERQRIAELEAAAERQRIEREREAQRRDQNPWIALNASLPPMSHEDRSQYDEDVSIISKPVRFIGGEGQARFGECASHWQMLHHNRPPQVRQVLYAVRVARCMFAYARGASYAVQPVRCPIDFASMLRPGCYARFS